MGRLRCFRSQETLGGQGQERGSPQRRQCSQRLPGEAVELVCAEGAEQAMLRLQRAAAPVKPPASVGLFLGPLRAPFPGMLSASSWEGRQARSWLVEGMKLLQEMLGHHRRACWQKRVTDGEKNRGGGEWDFRSSLRPRPASLPRGTARSAGFCCYCSHLPSSPSPA